MKFFVAFAAFVAVAVATPLHRPAADINTEMANIIAAIHSPNTDPATASLLEQMLENMIIAAVGDSVNVGPAIVEQEQSPVSVGPEMIDFPLPIDDEIIAEVAAPVRPSPVVVGPIAPGSPAPLVQLIVNINKAAADIAEVPVRPVVVPEAASPVTIVDEAENVGPIEIIDVTPVVISPVHVVDAAPVAVEPVLIGTPNLASPAVVLPAHLN